MPNHWHFVLWPREDGELTHFMRRLTHTHTQRWHAHRHTTRTGHLYQGRFKSFPVEQDDHLLTVIRYVERNALRAETWSSTPRSGDGPAYGDEPAATSDRRQFFTLGRFRCHTIGSSVNLAHTGAELEALRRSCTRGTPFGSAVATANRPAIGIGSHPTFPGPATQVKINRIGSRPLYNFLSDLQLIIRTKDRIVW